MKNAAMTYSKVKTAYTVAPDEKLCIVIALGYGENQGASHAVKTIEQVTQADGPLPDWFRSGIQAALLAPTAINQQKFRFILRGGRVAAKAGMGFYSKTDLGIVKYHFEIGAGKPGMKWGNA